AVAGAFSGCDRSGCWLIVARRSEAFRPPGALGGTVGDNGIGLGLDAINRILAGARVARRRGQKQDDECGTKPCALCHGLASIACGSGPPRAYQLPEFPTNVFRK